MSKYLIEFWLDGYDTDEERVIAEVEYIEDVLNMTASSVKVLYIVDRGE